MSPPRRRGPRHQRSTDARNADIVRLRASGETLADIGVRHRLTGERVRQILAARGIGGADDPERVMHHERKVAFERLTGLLAQRRLLNILIRAALHEVRTWDEELEALRIDLILGVSSLD